jgi:hypothetical protein
MAEDTVTNNAAARYATLEADRQATLERARKNAKITIPNLFPPDNYTDATALPDPAQSVGSMGVNTLASKITLAIFPPNLPFFRHDATIEAIADLEDTQPDQAEAIIEDARKKLSRYDRQAMRRVEASGDRPTVHQTMKHLLVGGNALLDVTQDKTRLFNLADYVNVRDPRGKLIELIFRESLARASLPPEALNAVEANEEGDGGEPADTFDIYTHVKLIKNMYHVYQEVAGVQIAGSEGTYKVNALPYISLRFTAVDGSHYGRSFIEDLYGDLETLEDLVRDIKDVAAMAARVVFLVSPNGTTVARAVSQAKTGDAISGDAADITTLQLDKSADMRIASETAIRTEERLKVQLLLNAGSIRDSERTTATEVRFIALELDDALSGVHALLSQEFQLPYIKLKIKQMKGLPDLPEGAADLIITTGLEALGRGAELQKYAQWVDVMQKSFGVEETAKVIDLWTYAGRSAEALGLDITGLLKTREVTQQEQTTKQMTEAATANAPAIIEGLSNDSQ